MSDPRCQLQLSDHSKQRITTQKLFNQNKELPPKNYLLYSQVNILRNVEVKHWMGLFSPLILCMEESPFRKKKPGGWGRIFWFLDFGYLEIYKFRRFYKKTPCATFFYGFYAVVWKAELIDVFFSKFCYYTIFCVLTQVILIECINKCIFSCSPLNCAFFGKMAAYLSE